MGVQLKAPEPKIAAERLLPFDIEAAMMQTLHFATDKTPHIPPNKQAFRKQSILWTPAEPIPVQIDGDYLGNTPMTFRAIPRSLWVLVPPNADRSLWQS